MPDKKLILLVVLGVLAVGTLIYGIVTPSRSRQGLTAQAGKGATASDGKTTKLPMERHEARSSYPNWGRSPFVLQTGTQEKGLVLNGIAWDLKAPKAIINDQIVGVGDRVAGQKVVAIQSTGVTLNDGVQDVELKLRRKK